MGNSWFIFLFYPFLFSVCAYGASDINGIWLGANNKYLIFAQDSVTKKTGMLEVESNQMGVQIWYGDAGCCTQTSFKLSNIKTGETVSFNMSDDLLKGIENSESVAKRVYTYSSEYDGVWRTKNSTYLVYLTQKLSNKNVSIAVDLNLNSYPFTCEFFLGEAFSANYFGQSKQGNLISLNFLGTSLTGTLVRKNKTSSETLDFAADRMISPQFFGQQILAKNSAADFPTDLPTDLSSLGAASPEKILVVAPHPDDEIITAAGVIYQALNSGKKVKVVYMTNGDFGSSLLGMLRQSEAINGMKVLGLREENLLFLSYPDGYLQEFFDRYQNATDSLMTAFNVGATYGVGPSTDFHTLRFGAPAKYNKANLILDVKEVLRTFMPDHIILPLEFDQHVDHIATYYFVKQALMELHKDLPQLEPTLHRFLVHWKDEKWPRKAILFEGPSAAIGAISPPSDWTSAYPNHHLDWSKRERVPVPLEMLSTNPLRNLKMLSLAAHFSQGGPSFYGNYIHSDEIFWTENLFFNSNTRLLPGALGTSEKTLAP